MDGRGRKHKRTESQAVMELENVFRSMDLEGEGKLDKASFSTALFSLDVSVEPDKLDDLFKQIDTEDRGYVAYEEFLKLIKSGNLNDIGGAGAGSAVGTLIDAAKVVPATYSSATAALVGAGSRMDVATVPTAVATPSKPKRKLDPKKKGVIQRAVIVIKKAAMKNISKDEVIEFLKDKGMSTEDIDYAYDKAQEQAMSKDERIQYMKQMMAKKDQELADQKVFVSHLTSQTRESQDQLLSMRKALLKATHRLLIIDKERYDVETPPKVVSEIQNQIHLQKKSADNQAGLVKKEISKGIKRLEQVFVNCQQKSYFHAWLFFTTLDLAVQNALPKTQGFLSEFE